MNCHPHQPVLPIIDAINCPDRISVIDPLESENYWNFKVICTYHGYGDNTRWEITRDKIFKISKLGREKHAFPEQTAKVVYA